MEESWENWHLHSELDPLDEGDEFLREILLQQQPPPPPFSSENESDFNKFSIHLQNDTVSASAANDVVVLASSDQQQGNLVKSNSTNSIENQQGCNSKTTRRLSSPKAYILSFDNSTMIPATPEPCVDHGQQVGKRDSSKRRIQNGEEKMKPASKKKGRSGSQTMDHIMAERKRRQELTQRFIALSATIPGLSKTDKASVLRATIDYVKHLQARVEELEKQDKKDIASVIAIKKSDLGNEDTTTTSNETSSEDDCCNNINILPEIEARVIGKEVLIEIHCEKEVGIELKLLTHLENLQLFVTSSSVLQFGNSSLSITIISEMGEEYKLTVNELVKSLRKVLLKSQLASDSDPY